MKLMEKGLVWLLAVAMVVSLAPAMPNLVAPAVQVFAADEVNQPVWEASSAKPGDVQHISDHGDNASNPEQPGTLSMYFDFDSSLLADRDVEESEQEYELVNVEVHVASPYEHFITLTAYEILFNGTPIAGMPDSGVPFSGGLIRYTIDAVDESHEGVYTLIAHYMFEDTPVAVTQVLGSFNFTVRVDSVLSGANPTGDDRIQPDMLDNPSGNELRAVLGMLGAAESEESINITSVTYKHTQGSIEVIEILKQSVELKTEVTINIKTLDTLEAVKSSTLALTFKWIRDGIEASAPITKALKDFEWEEDPFEQNQYIGKIVISLEIASATKNDAGKYTLDVLKDSTSLIDDLAHQHAITLGVWGLSDAPYFKWLETGIDQASETKTITDLNNSPISGSDNYDIILLDLTELPTNLDKNIEIASNIELVKILGEAGTIYTNAQIIVYGNTQVVLHNFNLLAPAFKPAIEFKGTNPILVSVGGPSDITAPSPGAAIQPKLINSLRGGAQASVNLNVYGNADIRLSGYNGDQEQNAGHGIDVAGNLNVDLHYAVLQAVGGAGGWGKPAEKHATNVVFAWQFPTGQDAPQAPSGHSGGNGGNGGHGIKAENVHFYEDTSVHLTGGDGGSGATGSDGAPGFQGGTGINGTDGGLGVFSTSGGKGGKGGKGGNGGNGSNGGNGGSPLVLTGTLASFAQRSYTAIGSPGHGGDGGNGGNGGTGGTGGTGGLPLIGNRKAQGDGGNGGEGGNAGNGGWDGFFGSFETNNTTMGAWYQCIAGYPGTEGAAGVGSKNGNPGTSGKSGEVPRSKSPLRTIIWPSSKGTYGPGFSNATIPKASYLPGEEIEITINATYGSDPTGAPQNQTWLLEFYSSLYDINNNNILPSDKHKIQLLHNNTGAAMEILAVSEYMNLYEKDVATGGYFTITVANPYNFTQAPSRDFIAVHLDSGGGFVHVGDTSTYDNFSVVWAEEVRILPTGSTLGRAVRGDEEIFILHSASNVLSLNVELWSRSDSRDLPSELPEGFVDTGRTPTFADSVVAELVYQDISNIKAVLREIVPARQETVEEAEYTEIIKYNEFQIELNNLPDFSLYPEGTKVTLLVYPQDYNFQDNTIKAKLEIPLYISHVLDARLEVLPANQKVTVFTGDVAQIRFTSPAHNFFVQQEVYNSYEVRIWELQGTWTKVESDWTYKDSFASPYYPWVLLNEDGIPAPFAPNAMDSATSPIAPTREVSNWKSSIFSIDTTNLEISTDMASPTEYLPKYLIQMTYANQMGVTIGEDAFAYLAIRPRLLSVSLSKNPKGYVYLDKAEPVTFTWNLTGTDPSSSVEVTRNGVELDSSDFIVQKNANGGSVSLTPVKLDKRLMDEYQIVVKATSGNLTRMDTTSFEIYNSDALEIILEKDYVGNIPKISTMTSQEILDLQGVINLSSPLSIDQSYDWTFYDLMNWLSKNQDVATLHTEHNNWWVDVRDFPRSGFHPNSDLLAIGHQQGEAAIKVTHTRTGMTDEKSFKVGETLHNKLYLISVYPAVETKISYSTGDGRQVTTSTNQYGQIAIYEPSGLVGFVRLQGVYKDKNKDIEDLYLGSIHASELESGERSPATKQRYPMNYLSMNRTSDQVFYAWQPDGKAYAGKVEVSGGVYANGKLIKDSIFPDVITAGAGGAFTIRMDSTRFGNINIADDLKFVYEIIFIDGNYAPRLLTVDGYAQDDRTVDLDAITLHLVNWDGNGFTAAQHLYKNDLGFEFDVTNHRTMVGISNDHPKGQLISNLASVAGTKAESIVFAESNGYIPPQQTVRSMNEDAPYLSGKYDYWQLKLTVDQNLQIESGKSRQFNVRIKNPDASLNTVNLSFQVANAIGISKPDYSSGFDLNFKELPGGTGMILEGLGLNANKVLSTIMGAVTPVSVALPDKISFETMILQDDINPFLYHVMGWYGGGIGAALELDMKTDNNGTELKAKYPSAIRAIRSIGKKAMKLFGEKAAKAANPSGWLNNIKAGTEISFKASFSSTVEGFFAKEYTYNMQASGNKWDDRTTEFRVHVELDTMAGLKVTIPTPLPPPIGSAIQIFVEYTQVFGLKVTVSSNTNNGRKLSDFILDVAANGSIKLRGGFVGSIPLVGEADIGLYGLLELLAGFVKDTYGEGDLSGYIAVRGTFGVDANVRLGPSFFPLYSQYFKLAEFVSPWGEILGELPEHLKKSNSPPSSAPLRANAAYRAMSTNPMPEEWSEYPPLSETAFVLVEKNGLEIAAWEYVNVPEETLEEIKAELSDIEAELNKIALELEEHGESDSELSVAQQARLADIMLLLQSYSEIIVSTSDGDSWDIALPLTSNLYPDVAPIIATNGAQAVVAWRQVFVGQNGENDTAELMYAVYNGTSWSEVNSVDFSINGSIASYDVAMNPDGEIVITMSVYSETSDETSLVTSDETSGEASGDNTTNGIFSVYAVYISEGNAKVDTKVYKVSTDGNFNINPKVIAIGKDFYISYYTDDYKGNSDIVLRKISDAGILDDSFIAQLSQSLGLYVLKASENYLLVSDDKDIALIWSAYNWNTDGDGVYAAKLLSNSGAFSSYIALAEAQAGYMAKVLNGQFTENIVSASYRSSKYEESLTDSPVNNTLMVAFENDFVFGALVNRSDVGIGRELPIQFVIINSGMEAITQITVKLSDDDTPKVWDNLYLLPGQVLDDYVVTKLGDSIKDMEYSVTATFVDEGDITRSGELILAIPDISIGQETVLSSENGIREFSLTLYNSNDTPLAGSDNVVHLNFYRDLTYTVPVNVTLLGVDELLPRNAGDILIGDNDLLSLIDAGGLSMRFSYAISEQDLDDTGEIIYDGAVLFAKAEIIGADGQAIEGIFPAASGKVVFNSLLRLGQDSIIASVNNFDSNAGTAEISLRNLSMKNVPLGSGRIVALLQDENNKVLEQQTITLENGLKEEEERLYPLTFTKRGGTDVVVNFAPLTEANTLSSLTLSGIPYIFDESSTGEETLYANNMHNVAYTNLVAAAGNSKATISINGIRYTDVASVVIPLNDGIVEVEIIVANGLDQTVYTLHINTGKVAIYTLSIVAGQGGSIVTGDNGYYYEGDKIAIKALANQGYQFTGWSSSIGGTFQDAANPDTVFTMPGNSTVVTALFKAVEESGGGSGGSGSGGSSGGGYVSPSNPGGSFAGGSEYKSGSGNSLIFTVQKDFSFFRDVRIDQGVLTRDSHYKAEKSSTKITLLAEYLDNLAIGWHSLEVRFSDGTVATTNFKIIGEPKSLPEKTETPVTPPEDAQTDATPLEEANVASPQPEDANLTPSIGVDIPFVDVSADDWFAAPVMWAYENGYIVGTSNDPMQFSPNMPLTRGMVVTVLYRMLGENQESMLSNLFDDVADDAWYAEAVKWAYHSGIVVGYGGDKFGPNDDITREQMAAILHNYNIWKGLDVSIGENADISSYLDAFEISEWANPAMQWAFGSGLIVGRSGEYLYPKAGATRAEFATVLMRLMEAATD